MLPETYTGEKSWDEWIDHFESMADVCGWNAKKKLKWLCVVGLGPSTFGCLSDVTRNDCEHAKEALKNRFEPGSEKTLYQTR